MIVFISYASDRRDDAEQVSLALIGSGHKVFFDRDSLPAGDDYHARIRKSVESSDAFIFLISSSSVAPGCYALTELKYARQKWPDPRQRVLPVMLERTKYEQIPNYLRAVTVLEPEGNVAAEVAAELERWGANAQRTFDPRSSSSRSEADVGRDKNISELSDFWRFGRQVAAGVVGALSAFLAGAGIVNAGALGFDIEVLLMFLFAALSLWLAYGLWPRHKRPR